MATGTWGHIWSDCIMPAGRKKGESVGGEETAGRKTEKTGKNETQFHKKKILLGKETGHFWNITAMERGRVLLQKTSAGLNPAFREPAMSSCPGRKFMGRVAAGEGGGLALTKPKFQQIENGEGFLPTGTAAERRASFPQKRMASLFKRRCRYLGKGAGGLDSETTRRPLGEKKGGLLFCEK